MTEIKLSQLQHLMLDTGDICMWFALCLENATTTRDHPILGPVPVCTEHLTFGVEMPKKQFDAGDDNIGQIGADDASLDKAGERKHSGDRAADALSDAARDIDSEPFTQ